MKTHREQDLESLLEAKIRENQQQTRELREAVWDPQMSPCNLIDERKVPIMIPEEVFFNLITRKYSTLRQQNRMQFDRLGIGIMKGFYEHILEYKGHLWSTYARRKISERPEEKPRMLSMFI